MKLSKDILRQLIKEQIEEACGDHAMRDDNQMQSIDMGMDHNVSDSEGNMAKRQMFKTAKYAAELFSMLQDEEELPAWVQSKMTKVADYIGAVKHYLEYDHVVGESKKKK